MSSLYLNNIQAGSTRPAHVNGDGFDQGTLSKVLDLFRHSGTEEQGLSLALEERQNCCDNHLRQNLSGDH